MANDKQVMYAFYGESSHDPSKNHRGDTTYLGNKSDGLNREYFGTDLEAAQKMVTAARKQRFDYRLDEITYERALFGGALSCKTRTLAVWPMSKAARTQSG